MRVWYILQWLSIYKFFYSCVLILDIYVVFMVLLIDDVLLVLNNVEFCVVGVIESIVIRVVIMMLVGVF